MTSDETTQKVLTERELAYVLSLRGGFARTGENRRAWRKAELEKLLDTDHAGAAARALMKSEGL